MLLQLEDISSQLLRARKNDEGVMKMVNAKKEEWEKIVKVYTSIICDQHNLDYSYIMAVYLSMPPEGWFLSFFEYMHALFLC